MVYSLVLVNCFDWDNGDSTPFENTSRLTNITPLTLYLSTSARH